MANSLTKAIWTQYISNGSLTIDDTYGFAEVSFVLISGTGTFQGTASANGFPSQAVSLVVGQAITVGSGSNALITGIQLTTTGTIQILGR